MHRLAALLAPVALALAAQVVAQPTTPVEAAQAAQADGKELRVEPRVQRVQGQHGQAREGHVRGSHAREVRLPAPLAANMQQILGAPQAGVPLKIGFARDVPGLDTEAGTRSSLEWETLADGSRVADIVLTSDGAKAIRAGLRVDSLPPQATVRVQAPGDTTLFETTGQRIDDALAANGAAGEQGPDARTWWSPVIEGPSITVEIELPAGVDPASVRVSLPKVSHLATSITQDFTTQASATCERDATCSIATWGNQMNAVARMIFSDGTYSYACSGTLLADQDPSSNIPYFLSANHCINTQSEASSLTTYWFYRSTACNSGVLGPYQQLAGGATLLYATTNTDTSFMRLNAAPPVGAVYAGWYVGTTPATNTTVTGLHHPGADMLKISTGYITGYLNCTAPSNGSFSCTSGTASSSTFYDIPWTSGITEPGSSGSGLFLGNGYLVGQLYGGSSSCTTLGEDAYGRFDVAYNAGLKKWLAAAPLALTVTKSGTGTGTVTSSPAGVNCGATCSASFASGSAVSLTATPASGSKFSGWSGACTGTGACTVTMNAAATVGAAFNLSTTSYTLAVANAGGGRVTSSPAGIDCTASCSAAFTQGTAVTLTATPASGYTFGGWSGGGCSGTGTCSITMNTNYTTTASFTSSTQPPPPPSSAGNVAAASAGGVATASSTYSASYPPSAAINGDRTGASSKGGVWLDGTRSAFPDWLQVQFSGPQTIDRVVVYSMQDNYSSPVEPSDTLTFTKYGIVDFQVQGWNGSGWIVLGSVTGNNLVKREVVFPATSTDRIRVVITQALGGSSRMAEVEAYAAGSTSTPATATVALSSSLNPSNVGDGVIFAANVTGAGATPTGTVTFLDGTATVCGPTTLASGSASCATSSLAAGTHPITTQYSGDAAYGAAVSSALSQVVNAPPPSGGGGATGNVALASAGGVATASSTYSASYPPAAAINGDRTGSFRSGGVWLDATRSTFPDWLQVQFAGTDTIDRVVVYSMQDNYSSPIEPTDTMTFTKYGVVDFQVQVWNGSSWVTVASVAGNDLVKRTVTFSPVSTDRVRILITQALGGSSRLAEVEAWTN